MRSRASGSHSLLVEIKTMKNKITYHVQAGFAQFIGPSTVFVEQGRWLPKGECEWVIESYADGDCQGHMPSGTPWFSDWVEIETPAEFLDEDGDLLEEKMDAYNALVEAKINELLPSSDDYTHPNDN
jgi:hypothetical protein